MSETVYISGPMTGYVDFNRQAFRVAERRLRNMGFENIVNPVTLDEHHPLPGGLVDGTPESHAWYMRRDIAALVNCDAIYLLPGWRWSKGANLEHKVAQAIGLREIVDPNPKAWACLEGEPLDEGHRKARECEGAIFGGHPRFDCQATPVLTNAAHNEGVRA